VRVLKERCCNRRLVAHHKTLLGARSHVHDLLLPSNTTILDQKWPTCEYSGHDTFVRLQVRFLTQYQPTALNHHMQGFWQHGNTTISVFYKWLNEFTLIVAQNWALYPSNSDSDRSGKPAGPALQRDSVEILTLEIMLFWVAVGLSDLIPALLHK
jgi:hypothetical protein